MTLATQTVNWNDGLVRGLDFRKKQHRRSVFQRFYSFHLRYASHPGGVYYALPYMAKAFGWDTEQRAWAAFLNGNTQNPVTTLLLMQAADRPGRAGAVLDYWNAHYSELSWDTDRRHHKARFDTAVRGYVDLVRPSQSVYWRKAVRGGWDGCWRAANAIPTMGRLSTWSYLEYLKILRVADIPDADTLMLDDISGSRSHRNGLLLLLGHDELVWWKNNPNFSGRYDKDIFPALRDDGEQLLREAQALNPGHPDVGYLTLESALCTWKSWHRPNRRYPGVYNDMFYDRIKSAEAVHGKQFDVLWDARKEALPPDLRLESSPNDPGCVAPKQNHYLNTGQVVTMDRDWACFQNHFRDEMDTGHLRKLRKWN